ncbi:MAG: hypothetical protein II876_12990 [Synergistaceae bacterium]|nr:hypothetical protein [Synergistaceae bacterium]
MSEVLSHIEVLSSSSSSSRLPPLTLSSISAKSEILSSTTRSAIPDMLPAKSP